MTSPGNNEEPDGALARLAAQAAASKGGEDILILEVGPVLAICDTFVLASGGNRRQVKAIAEEVELQVKAAGGPAPLRMEGMAEAEWVLLDYGDVVVHVFSDEARRFYELERLWRDAPRTEWEEAAVER